MMVDDGDQPEDMRIPQSDKSQPGQGSIYNNIIRLTNSSLISFSLNSSILFQSKVKVIESSQRERERELSRAF
jgi:hypothetical protein